VVDWLAGWSHFHALLGRFLRSYITPILTARGRDEKITLVQGNASILGLAAD